MDTATFVKEMKDWSSDAALYKLDPPLKDYEPWEEGKEQKYHEYVVVSATMVPFVGGIETYIFGADEEGNVPSMVELPGSLKGTLSHADALREAGYEIVRKGGSPTKRLTIEW